MHRRKLGAAPGSTAPQSSALEGRSLHVVFRCLGVDARQLQVVTHSCHRLLALADPVAIDECAICREVFNQPRILQQHIKAWQDF